MDGIDCTIIRGGSSKGIYIERDDLPPAGVERDRVILEIFGSPDVRQIDGLGGADKLTSKVCVMGKSSRPDCALDYLFGQVGTEMARIDWTSNCGNLSAGAALYGAHRGYISAAGDMAEYAIHQVNTGRQLRVKVPMRNGRPISQGDFAIGGVPGTGARIDLDFGDFGGGAMKRGILPTGNPVDSFDVPGLPGLQVSVIDAANLCIFVRASDVGLDPLTSVVDLQAERELVARLEAIRATVSRAIGFVTENVEDEMRVRVNPLLFAVARPLDYTALNGSTVRTRDHDILARSIARGAFSKAYPGTGSIGTAVACGIEGSIAAEAFAGRLQRGQDYAVRIGHPSGHLQVDARLAIGAKPILQKAIIGRTARVLMDGRAYLRTDAEALA